MSRPTNSTRNNQQITSANQAGLEQQIRILERSLADVQNPGTLKHRTANNLLAHADLICDVLDVIKDFHPAIEVAVVPFKAVLHIVLVKQDNDKRVAALMVEMIDMMSALLELRNIKDVAIQSATKPGETMQSSLKRVLNNISTDIDEAGHLVNKYSRVHVLHRVLRAHEWADQFKQTVECFMRRKVDIQAALSINTAMKMDNVLHLMQEWFERPQSSHEREFLARVQRDGPQTYLENETAFKNLYKDLPPEQGRESASSMQATRPMNEREKARKAKEEWDEIKKPLKDFLSETRAAFEALLEVQKKDLTTTIRQSENTIIKAINEGPHSYITHPDIRHLWKTMQWRLSVKTRHFVMSLHDHYLHAASSASHVGNTNGTGHTTPSSPGDGFQCEPLDSADRWCLQYLRIRYLPAISEAFDDDGSGFIKISEVNDFTEDIPEGWNLPKWVAYWAVGWPSELMRYSHLIQSVMVQLWEAQCKVKPENMAYVNDYMNGFALSEIKLLINSIQYPDVMASGKSELYRLTAELRSKNESYLRSNLEKVKYSIDDPDKLPLLCGPGRVEKYLFPLLFLILEKHLEIVQFASQCVLDPREMSEAEDSLDNVLEKVWQRVEELKESFRQQKLNINEHFQSFACGIYSQYQFSDASKWIGQMPQPPLSPDEDDSDGTSDEYSGENGDAESETSSPRSSSVDPETLQESIISSPLIYQRGPVGQGNENSATIANFEGTLGIDSGAYASPMAEDFNSHTATSPDGENPQESNSAFARVGGLDTSGKAENPTHFPPVSLDLETSFYMQPHILTEDTVPWCPLRVQYSEIGPKEMFRMAAQRVLERVQLLYPRLTWEYLKRRRSIRMKWIEITLRSDQQYLGDDEWEDWNPSNEEVREELEAQVTPADISYYDSLAQQQGRLRVLHMSWCDGCNTQIFGKRFGCLDCTEFFDLCDECEHAESPRHDVVLHPPTHTMLQYNYPVISRTQIAFENRARKYMIKHFKNPCPCCNPVSTSASDGTALPLRCSCCGREIKNEVHFRCLQCSDYDLCEDCEQNPLRQLEHCQAHALLKLKTPFSEQEYEGSEDTDDEEQPSSVETRLDRLTRRVVNLETKFGGRLDELQKGFTRLDELQKGFARFDEIQQALERLDELQKGFSRLDELQKGFTRLDELQKDFTRAVSLLEHFGSQEKRWSYLYGATKAPSF